VRTRAGSWRPCPRATLDQALASVPPGARDATATAAREGFLAGFNEILVAGGGQALAGAVAALWLVRERDIEHGQQTAREAPAHARGAVPEAGPA
jgi:hypothetical protein